VYGVWQSIKRNDLDIHVAGGDGRADDVVWYDWGQELNGHCYHVADMHDEGAAS